MTSFQRHHHPVIGFHVSTKFYALPVERWLQSGPPLRFQVAGSSGQRAAGHTLAFPVPIFVPLGGHLVHMGPVTVINYCKTDQYVAV
jgi:hypothetical protein